MKISHDELTTIAAYFLLDERETEENKNKVLRNLSKSQRLVEEVIYKMRVILKDRAEEEGNEHIKQILEKRDNDYIKQRTEEVFEDLESGKISESEASEVLPLSIFAIKN